ncbi:MAG: Polymer-forming cytoskeletal [Microgenomates bacterium OLB23]|nr:MAG: Polymer-forming cytoskeletal [Microgenomates bacterium OLB23]
MNFKRFIIAFLLLGAFAVSSFAYAQDTQQPDFDMQDIVMVNEDDIINHDVFSFGEMTDIKGTINGDVYTAGGEVTVDGRINGDVLAAGGEVRILQSAIVAQDIRVAGGTVTIDGTVNGNITAAGGKIIINNAARVNGSFTAAGGEIRIDAPVNRNVKLVGQSVAINSPIAGGADIMVQDLSFGTEGRIQGNLSYVSEQEFVIGDGIVGGTIQHKLPPQEMRSAQEQPKYIMGRVFTFMGLLSLVAKLFVGLLLIHLFPTFSNKASDKVGSQIWRSLGTGFLIVVLSPILIVALFATIVAFPLASMLLVGYLFVLYLASIFVMLALGKMVIHRINKKWNDAAAFVVGLLALFVVGLIPVLNIFVCMAVTCIGIGAFVNTKLEVYKDLRKKNLL